MPDLLFINKNAQSSSLAHSTEASEKTSIRAHVQRGRRHTRRDRTSTALTTAGSRQFELRPRPEPQQVSGEKSGNRATDQEEPSRLPTRFVDSGGPGIVGPPLQLQASSVHHHFSRSRLAEESLVRRQD